ncbi:C40 family peptidase [uncultured Croceitalea sp.]|uniref:C40 family peptidase n=1 Tax=uncultured Croceitalea sp. TaxID=1798908 RepID=UPI00374EE792
MNKKLLILSIAILLSGCFAKKKTTYSKKRTVTVASSDTIKSDKKKLRKKVKENPEAEKVIESAMAFNGVRYKYGGTTKKGMDCSGLIYVALQENDIVFPRVSYQMANEGKRVRVNEVQKGDLLFFKTRKNSKRINHVGLVVAIENEEIKFIHSSSSRGVIVSSLREGFWNAAFIKATRIL